MITEIFIFKIDPAEETAFEKMYMDVVPVLRRQKGYRSDKLMRSIEHPEDYILAVEWDSVPAHQAFIDSDAYPEMSVPFGEYSQEGKLAHYNTVASN